MGALFLIALAVQLTRNRYVPAIYWTVVALVSVVGTLVTDNLTDTFGISLKTTSIVFACALALVFLTWWLSERTLSVHTIVTPKREAFYWGAILFTFALGTATGDLTAEAFGLAYGVSLLVFAGLIALTALAYYAFKINGVLAFWIAYVLTRPLGASTGDLLAQSPKDGGLGFGPTAVSALCFALMIGLTIYLTVQQQRANGAGRAANATAAS